MIMLKIEDNTREMSNFIFVIILGSSSKLFFFFNFEEELGAPQILWEEAVEEPTHIRRMTRIG